MRLRSSGMINLRNTREVSVRAEAHAASKQESSRLATFYLTRAPWLCWRGVTVSSVHAAIDAITSSAVPRIRSSRVCDKFFELGICIECFITLVRTRSRAC